jgi:hypothetical protein
LQVKAGEVGHRQILQGARLEDHVEVGLKIVPVDFAQAGDPGIAVDPADTETQAVAQLELQARGQSGLHRDSRHFAGLNTVPPTAGAQWVVARQFGGPGQAEVALDRAFALGILADDLPYRLAVDHHQATRHHRVEWRRHRRKLREAVGESVLIGRQYVQGEMIGRLLW